MLAADVQIVKQASGDYSLTDSLADRHAWNWLHSTYNTFRDKVECSLEGFGFRETQT